MKNTLIAFLCSLVVSYAQNNTPIYQPEVNATQVQSNFIKWKDYFEKEILLSLDFNAVDESSRKISKEKFLEQLTEGKFIPIKINSKETTNTYQLFSILPDSDSSIKATIVEKSFNELHNFYKEGKAFPSFSFTDLKGNLITNASMHGKIIVIKCWFIHCAFCIKEFPEVNALAEKYKNRNDIEFISLAEDTSDQLKAFLAKKPLLYAVVPDMKKYMNEELQLNAFPTHFILDKEGNILKVASNFKSLELALEVILQQ
ncbi:TlpA family protein disulfide reductase [Flavobacterium sp.]